MTITEMEAAVSALCLSGRYGSLHRLLKSVGLIGVRRILSGDMTAEQKRRAIIALLKSENPGSGNFQGFQNTNFQTREK